MGKKRSKSLKMPKLPKMKGGNGVLPNPNGGPVPGGPSSGIPAPSASVPGHPPIPGAPVVDTSSVGGTPLGWWGMFTHRLQYLNESKYFAGLCMIMLNVGSKYVAIKFSKSAEAYFKANVTNQLLVFSMAWMVTRDILIALIITAVFVVLSDHLFNEESSYCIVPEKYRVLSTLVDTDGDGIITDEELEKAEETLRKARQQKIRQDQRSVFQKFDTERE